MKEIIELGIPKYDSVKLNPFEYVLNSKKVKGVLDWTYKPFYNLRITDDKNKMGEITELDTEKLNFSLTSPVEMLPQPSYDGSVNLILTDNRNIPRLINSRFTVRGNNTYERVDRLGENDTNLYDQNKFLLQTSLLKLYNLIPKIKFNGESLSGNLPVGNYVFYFSYCDADENETDIVAESGIVSIFKGQNMNPSNIEGGYRDENSYKSVQFTIKNIDSEYSYLKVYYIRYSADNNEHKTANAYKIHLKYQVKNNKCIISINGLENTLEISENEINILYATINKSKTLESVLNRLFLGNILISTPEYKELLDLSLRIYPSYEKKKCNELIGNLDEHYLDTSNVENGYQYYNSSNIYNYVGYAPNEIYRIGIVYIMHDNSLSPVFNIRGRLEIPEFGNLVSSSYTEIKLKNENGSRKYIDKIDETTHEFIDGKLRENSKGVISINDEDDLCVYNLKFMFLNDDVLTELKKYAKGYFFVRLKRIPLMLGLALTLPLEVNTSVPLIPYTDSYLCESFMDKERYIVNEYKDRLLNVKEGTNNNLAALIFPEFELNQPYYNTILTGGKFFVKEAYYNNTKEYLSRDSENQRHYIIGEYSDNKSIKTYRNTNLILVADNVKMVGIGDHKFAARAGEAEEGFRYGKVANVEPYKNNNTTTWVGKVLEKALKEYDVSLSETTKSINYVRGSYGPYVGMLSDGKINYGKIVNVYIPGYSEYSYNNYFKIRYGDDSEYNAISDRANLIDSNSFQQPVYRGDSYICNFTHRLNRNFNDPASPMNDKIVDKKTWRDHFDVSDGVVKKEKFEDINLGDLNAVKLGSWITIKVRCSKNISLRSQDYSRADEYALFGHPRSFYPISPMSDAGSYKIPESSIINDAYNSSVGAKKYIGLPDVPYFKDSFLTRIYYSDIYINDAYINGYRRILGNAYRDYETLYGELVKLIAYGRDLVCVFEHGISKLSINLQTPISLNLEEPVFINSHNVLPESMIVISDTIGSLWKDSVIKTEAYIYGVDTDSKKIWRYGAKGLQIISDMRILSFLNNNIKLQERELTPYLGLRNIKTHYNKNKGDVMFTYYNCIGKILEDVWNICWNEKLDKWITFYSWIPSFSCNIYNNYFSFDRNASKYMAIIGRGYKGSNDASGIMVDNYILGGTTLSLGDDIILPEVYGGGTKVSTTYTPCRDIYGFSRYYKIEDGKIVINDKNKILKIMSKYELPLALLTIDALITISVPAGTHEEVVRSYNGYLEYNSGIFRSTIGLTTDAIYGAETKDLLEKPNLSSWFWSHGKTGIFDIKDEIYPTKWYEKQHPFEFEFVVNPNIDLHKIFDDLEIISNNSAPESFHYEIVGDSFAFANDKLNMYIRLEATKELYQYNHFDVTYDINYTKYKEYLRPIELIPGWFDKSTLFPLYYSRLDKLNTIEDYYHLKDNVSTKDFSMLAGAEVTKNSRDKEFHIWNHALAVDLQLKNRLRGNMHYKEDKWYVQINPINLIQYNETAWEGGLIPIELGQSPIPNEILENNESLDNPTGRVVVSWPWTDSDNLEVKVKDKWMKVRIRYKGDNLSTIHSVQTLYNITKS